MFFQYHTMNFQQVKQTFWAKLQERLGGYTFDTFLTDKHFSSNSAVVVYFENNTCIVAYYLNIRILLDNIIIIDTLIQDIIEIFMCDQQYDMKLVWRSSFVFEFSLIFLFVFL
eukprot:TRINITY_DN29834_c1_g3_i1.p5 TRINITY_DN29834_c1_g3~~TRINITY_DN29834_c1_g3_i1.p5  ORF type:complete len:113 (+),score=1.87 TRINITY_DN29834_c1_g3_i1:503-841(+)